MAFMFLLIGSFIWAERVSLSIGLSYLGKEDGGFKDVYGSGGTVPGARAEARLWESLSLYAGYGYFTKKGTTPVFKEEAEATQHLLSVGVNWEGKLVARVIWGIYAGLLYVRYEEEALGEVIKDDATGFEGGISLRYDFLKRFFLFSFLSYLRADDEVERVKIKLGGWRAGANLGVRF
jgi:hypothetical protein